MLNGEGHEPIYSIISITKNSVIIQEGNTQANTFTEMTTDSQRMIFSLLLSVSSCFQVLRVKSPDSGKKIIPARGWGRLGQNSVFWS